MEHPSLSLKQSEEELLKVGQEFVELVRPIVENRKRIKETNEDLIVLLKEAIVKFDYLTNLQTSNAEKEAEVLEMLKRELNR